MASLARLSALIGLVVLLQSLLSSYAAEEKKAGKDKKADAEATAKKQAECSKLGFTEELMCSTCARLKEFLPSGDQKNGVEGDSLIAECQKCCRADEKDLFKSAILYVCPSQLELNQDVEDFVKKKADKIQNLEVRYMDGARLTIQLLREGETDKDSTEYVNVRGWKSDELKDFVNMKVGNKDVVV
eukprot:gnl/TRDRNA2_/TRDRNA2_188530_c0_seq1.p1 gnl/TRDRNA2_/TRDRNA2_188530_c0~~gnl/TRDRNA2_/TRDRNA2_188530_c0_seq1.p1  ORF type:complete len:203 (+),score=57.09 gnl/TRDRNA2_/TRDRNA2_188530_c0_seq1:54-611(+)